MRRWIAAALLIGFAVAAPVAAQPELGTLWTLPCGQLGDHQAESGFNRRENLVHAASLVRIGLQVTLDGVFDPEASNVLLQPCWNNGSILQAIEDHGYRVALVLLIHDQGSPNGWNYHNARSGSQGPILDRSVILSWFQSLMAYISEHHPGLHHLGANNAGIWAVSLGNETAYCPNGCPSPDQLVEDWLRAWDHLAPHIPSAWLRIDGGMLAKLERPAFEMNSRNLIGSVHCNGRPDSECRELIEACVDRYGECIIDEDRQPTTSHNHAPQRYAICSSTPGCIGYFPFGGRCSNNPPDSGCCWSVGGCGPSRDHIGIEGCAYEWQDGEGSSAIGRAARSIARVFRREVEFLNERTGVAESAVQSGEAGTYKNWQKFLEAAEDAGSLDGSWDFDALPNRIEGEPPPPPDDCSLLPNLPGFHQWLMLEIRYAETQLGVDAPNPAQAKCDPVMRDAYCNMLRTSEAAIQCEVN